MFSTTLFKKGDILVLKESYASRYRSDFEFIRVEGENKKGELQVSLLETNITVVGSCFDFYEAGVSEEDNSEVLKKFGFDEDNYTTKVFSKQTFMNFCKELGVNFDEVLGEISPIYALSPKKEVVKNMEYPKLQKGTSYQYCSCDLNCTCLYQINKDMYMAYMDCKLGSFHPPENVEVELDDSKKSYRKLSLEITGWDMFDLVEEDFSL